MSAARRKGKWVGGMPILDYNFASNGGSLEINGDDAQRIRAVFELYLDHQVLCLSTDFRALRLAT